MEVVASLSQGRTAAAQCGLFTHKSIPVIFEPPCNSKWYGKPPKSLCDLYSDYINYESGPVYEISRGLEKLQNRQQR